MRRLLIVGLCVLACKKEEVASGMPIASKEKTPAEAADAKAPDAKEAPPLPEPKFIEPIGDAPSPESEKVKVQLPPVPEFSDETVPAKHPDGVWSIAGLRADLDEQVKLGDAGTLVEVRGWVTKIYVPPECPEGEVCPPAKQPHLWITDTEDEKGLKRALMVVNYAYTIPEWDAARWRDQPDVILEVGKQYTFKGRFKQFSDTGFAYDRGLLEFVAYHPRDPDTGAELADWVYPRGSYEHPLEVARQEEENAALAEKVGRP